MVSTVSCNAQYIHTLPVQCITSGDVLFRREHSFQVVVEGIMTGNNLEAALLLFIRRIVEEGSNLEHSNRLIGVVIAVKSSSEGERSKQEFTFPPSEIRTAKKQMLMSRLTAAAIDGGVISLRGILIERHALPRPRSASFEPAHDPSLGHTSLSKAFHFTFIDRASGVVRCFARNPYESLAGRVFMSVEEAKRFQEVFVRHYDHRAASSAAGGNALGEQQQQQLEEEQVTDSGSLSLTGAVSAFVHDQSRWYFRALDECRLVDAVEHAVLLLAHCSSLKSSRLPLCVLRLSSVTAGPAGYLRSCRDAAESTGTACRVVLQRILEVPEAEVPNDRVLWSDALRSRLEAMEVHAGSIGAAVDEIRTIIGDICQHTSTSERECVNSCLRHVGNSIQRLTKEKNDQIVTHLREMRGSHSILQFFGDRLLTAVTIRWLRGLQPALQRLAAYIQAVEASLSADTLTELIQLDESRRLMPPAGAVLGPHGEEVHDVTKRLPLTVSEALGFLLDVRLSRDITHMQYWRSLPVTRIMRLFIRPHALVRSPVAAIGSGHSRLHDDDGGGGTEPQEHSELFFMDTRAEEAALSMQRGAGEGLAAAAAAASQGESRSMMIAPSAREYARSPITAASVSRFWRVYFGLGAPWTGRLGAVDAITALMDEVYRYDCPRGAAEEGTRFRYLTETRLAR